MRHYFKRRHRRRHRHRYQKLYKRGRCTQNANLAAGTCANDIGDAGEDDLLKSYFWNVHLKIDPVCAYF